MFTAGSKIHYLGQEKSNSLHGSTQVVNIHYLGQIHNLGQNRGVKFALERQRPDSEFSENYDLLPCVRGRFMPIYLSMLISAN